MYIKNYNFINIVSISKIYTVYYFSSSQIQFCSLRDKNINFYISSFRNSPDCFKFLLTHLGSSPVFFFLCLFFQFISSLLRLGSGTSSLFQRHTFRVRNEPTFIIVIFPGDPKIPLFPQRREKHSPQVSLAVFRVRFTQH